MNIDTQARAQTENETRIEREFAAPDKVIGRLSRRSETDVAATEQFDLV